MVVAAADAIVNSFTMAIRASVLLARDCWAGLSSRPSMSCGSGASRPLLNGELVGVVMTVSVRFDLED